MRAACADPSAPAGQGSSIARAGSKRVYMKKLDEIHTIAKPRNCVRSNSASQPTSHSLASGATRFDAMSSAMPDLERWERCRCRTVVTPKASNEIQSARLSLLAQIWGAQLAAVCCVSN
jgi:hypothetical protein